MSLVRRYPVTVICTLVGVGSVVGMIIDGPHFLTRAIRVPEPVAQVWMLMNLFLVLGALFYVGRNMIVFIGGWNWQELGYNRGTFMLLFAGALGYLGRVFESPAITLGTPLFTAGVLMIIWATVRPPERLEKEMPDGHPR